MDKNNKRYAVIVSEYPSKDRPNVLGFVHSRNRAYKRLGIDVVVYCIDKKEYSYSFEDIVVICGGTDYIKKKIEKINYDAILIHFLDEDKINIVGDRKCIIWVHGFEALSWKRRLFNLNPRIPLYILENTRQLNTFRKYVIEHPKSKFIFVSKWMYDVTCRDINYTIPNYEIIHNYIDKTIFDYQEKDQEKRKKILLVRSFANKKYANDISVDIIKRLSKKPYFKELSFTIYGEGKLFKRLTSQLIKFNNVSITNKFLPQKKVSEIHKNNGVFLCPTRQDAQGVSMCEAMSSGLVPLTSDNTAIPEFVENMEDGMLCNNKDIDTFVDAYDIIYKNGGLFDKISKKTSLRIQEQCSFENTILKEIKVIDQL